MMKNFVLFSLLALQMHDVFNSFDKRKIRKPENQKRGLSGACGRDVELSTWTQLFKNRLSLTRV